MKKSIQNDLKESLKKKDENRISVLKMILAAINNAEIKLKKKEDGLSEEETQKAIKSEAKKRSEAIEAYTKANRPELAEKEQKELLIIKSYLPEELSDEEIEKIAEEVIQKTGANSAQDFGKIMKEVLAKTQGRADGKKTSEIVKNMLN
ncbi:GatB/YqeY domain-containing protein [Patescibacteria group bacterium]|nr:GatB/YqeY domain-containing protein [Patescibacteria group bacterium]